ncbi:MAG: hypothetical protein EAZ85_02795 [Bacteroidetes bacterium]|nr:MAG: hypothetical protein EAZ85_02795 [Bacteroidota bacterium]
MVKKQKKANKYSEGDLIDLFGLNRLKGNDKMALMSEWTTIDMPILTAFEQQTFDIIFENAYQNIEGWNEEELKMKFLAFVVILGHLSDTKWYKTYYEREIFTKINDIYLYVKTDFMIAKGNMDKPKIPYFYFQEYKKLKDPNGDPVAQLLEAFLIAQKQNSLKNTLYGCTVTGKLWDFFILEDKTYCISKSYDCTEKDGLLQIIGILRKFKEILETKLLDK